MNKCRHPEHPHCTHWVMPGADACAGGHAQAEAATQQAGNAAVIAQRTAPELPVQAGRPGVPALQGERRAPVLARPRPTMHVSGFDPRAAGGRQALRLELRGMPADVSPQLTMQLRSALLASGSGLHHFARTRHGEWPSTVIEFSSRGREHGQYRIEVELLAHRDGAPPRRWTCTLVVLVPRPDATLTEIHQTFLATHKNVRVLADDGSIARFGAEVGGGRLDIDVTARNASIAQINVDGKGGNDLALPTIAWDEDLIETGMAAGVHPQPAQAACLVNGAPGAGEMRYIRLFAFDECVLGRLQVAAPAADVLLAHVGEHGAEQDGLTRRLSAQHAVLRRGLHGFEIEDVSRYGLLVDGVWPGKYVPVALQAGMRIEFTASVRNVVTLEVTAVLAHAVVMHRVDGGALAECFCFLAPDRHPGPALPAGAAGGLADLYHASGGFWHLDRASGRETPLLAGARCDGMPGMAAHTRFAASPYPELQLDSAPAAGRRCDYNALRSRALHAPA